MLSNILKVNNLIVYNNLLLNKYKNILYGDKINYIIVHYLIIFN